MTRNHILPLLVVFVVLLAGCTVGGGYWVEYSCEGSSCHIDVTGTDQLPDGDVLVVRNGSDTMAAVDSGETFDADVPMESEISVYRVDLEDGSVSLLISYQNGSRVEAETQTAVEDGGGDLL